MPVCVYIPVDELYVQGSAVDARVLVPLHPVHVDIYDRLSISLLKLEVNQPPSESAKVPLYTVARIVQRILGFCTGRLS